MINYQPFWETLKASGESTYSLIHDDLPCMDNDDLRRGKPTNHVVFGECTATLAGDALQAEAFRTILSTELPAEMRAECARLLAEAAGENGICGGQQLDMEGEGKALTKEELMDINDRKTSAMIYAACLMGVTCGGGNGGEIYQGARSGLPDPRRYARCHQHGVGARQAYRLGRARGEEYLHGALRP